MTYARRALSEVLALGLANGLLLGAGLTAPHRGPARQSTFCRFLYNRVEARRGHSTNPRHAKLHAHMSITLFRRRLATWHVS